MNRLFLESPMLDPHGTVRKIVVAYVKQSYRVLDENTSKLIQYVKCFDMVWWRRVCVHIKGQVQNDVTTIDQRLQGRQGYFDVKSSGGEAIIAQLLGRITDDEKLMLFAALLMIVDTAFCIVIWESSTLTTRFGHNEISKFSKEERVILLML